MSAALGVPVFLYFPYAIFNIASPILTLLYGITGFKIERLSPEEMQAQAEKEAQAEAQIGANGQVELAALRAENKRLRGELAQVRVSRGGLEPSVQ